MPRHQAVGWVGRVKRAAAAAGGRTSRRRTCHPPRANRAPPTSAASSPRRTPPQHTDQQQQAIALFASQTQVGDMLQCAAKEVERSGRHLSYSDLRALATERGLSRQLGKILEKNGTSDKKRRSRKVSKGSVGNNYHDVFLGGSCNPTTWRRDIAIPLLESLGITYYNPQVGDWSSELVAVEHRAKETARVLFYVLDRSTRNVVGIVEAANFATTRRTRLVLVMDSYIPGQPIAGEIVSKREFEELTSGLATLKDLLERQGIPVFHNIAHAIKSTAQLLCDKEKVGINKVHSLPDNLDQVQVGDKYFALREAFNALDTSRCGEISLKDCCMAYQWLTSKALSVNDLIGIIDCSNKKDYNESAITINFDQFCVMVNKLRLQNGATPKWSSCCSNLHLKPSSECFDLYICGLSTYDTDYLNLISPLLDVNGLKYRLSENQIPGSSKAKASEIDVMDSSRVLLFIISSGTRGIDIMAVASYYIGMKKNVVLCIQQLKEDAIIEGEKLSKVAVNDYNRGRIYLGDEARRCGVPVFSRIEESVSAAVNQTNCS